MLMLSGLFVVAGFVSSCFSLTLFLLFVVLLVVGDATHALPQSAKFVSGCRTAENVEKGSWVNKQQQQATTTITTTTTTTTAAATTTTTTTTTTTIITIMIDKELQ